MQHSSIVAFLSGTLSPEDLVSEIADEVAAFRKSLRLTRNGFIKIDPGSLFLVTRDGARRLLCALRDERLPFDVANYITDCIVMNDDFEFADDETRDAIHFVEDDSERCISSDESWRPSRDEVLAQLALLDGVQSPGV